MGGASKEHKYEHKYEKKFKFVIYEKKGNIVRITLNRPEKLNAFGMALDPVDTEPRQYATTK